MKNKNITKTTPLSLRFSPTAWSKLLFCRDITEMEVGGFGITKADDLLYVTDFVLVKQKVTLISVSFDDEAIGNFFEEQVDSGNKPEQFARIWLHTHPGDSCQPSCTDESTFKRVFGNCSWSVMAIVAQNNSSYARLHFNSGPGGDIKIPVCVDCSNEFGSTDFELWKKQYQENVIQDYLPGILDKSKEKTADLPPLDSRDILDEIDLMEPVEREFFMNELAIRSEFWNEYENEVYYD